MSAETGSHRRLEIAHVLLVDIVGYSKLLLNEQSQILDELNEVVRSTEQVRLAQDAGALLRLPTGDGVALIFRSSPEAPAQCALEIARALKSHPKLQLRMGIHSGPVNEVTSADDRANIAGAGINIAQRVMDCGDAGHILLSKRVAQDLESHEGWRPYLHDLGEVTVKHGVSIHIVNLYTDDLGEAQVPAKIQRERDAEAILARRARRKRRNALIFGSRTALENERIPPLSPRSSRQDGFSVALPLNFCRNLRLAQISGVKVNNVNTDAMLDRYFSQIMQVRSPALVTLQILRDAFA